MSGVPTGPRVALVPGVLALLPEYAGLEDPVAELRQACLSAVGRLGATVTVLADEQGRRVAGHLLGATARTDPTPSYLVIGNGSARRTERAPGFLDERAVSFDAGLGRCLKDGLRDSLAALDTGLATELLASVESIVELGRLDGLAGLGPATVTYEDDPFGVQYWVMTWNCTD